MSIPKSCGIQSNALIPPKSINTAPVNRFLSSDFFQFSITFILSYSSLLQVATEFSKLCSYAV